MHPIKKHIYIIGSGAIGKALAVFLKLSGKKVTLIRGSVNDGSRKVECLRVEMADGAIRRSNIEITTLDNFSTISGTIVLTNKSFGNEKLAISLRPKIGNSPIVILQNGLGIEQPFIRHQYPEIYRCVLFVTSQTVDPVTVRFKPIAISPIGIEKGNKSHLDKIVTQLSTPEFEFKSERYMQQVIWKKSIVNCVFNTVCPLLEVDNGLFHRSAEARRIAKRVIAECTAIARAKGIDIHVEEVEISLLQISRLSGGQYISTLQDLWTNRKTEIETLNYEVVKIAESLNKGELVHETRLLGELTKLKTDSSTLLFKENRNIQ